MGFLNIGTWELLILAIAGLMIFGPGKLPEVAGQLGKAVRDFRRMTADLTGEFEKTISEVDDVKRSVRAEVTGMRSHVDSVTSSVKKDLAATGTGVEAAAKRATATPKKSGGSTKRTTARTAATTAAAPVATKADPLADVSVLDEADTVPAPGTANGKTGTAPPPGRVAGAAKDATRVNGGAASDAVVAAPAALAVSGPNGEPSEERVAALARARQRRATAGYNRRPPAAG